MVLISVHLVGLGGAQIVLFILLLKYLFYYFSILFYKMFYNSILYIKIIFTVWANFALGSNSVKGKARPNVLYEGIRTSEDDQPRNG